MRCNFVLMFVRYISDPSMLQRRSCSKRRHGSLVLDRLRPHMCHRYPCRCRCRRSRSTLPGCETPCLLRPCNVRRSAVRQVRRGLLISWHVSRRRPRRIRRPRLMRRVRHRDTRRCRLSRGRGWSSRTGCRVRPCACAVAACFL